MSTTLSNRILDNYVTDTFIEFGTYKLLIF